MVIKGWFSMVLLKTYVVGTHKNCLSKDIQQTLWLLVRINHLDKRMLMSKYNWATSWQNQQNECAPSEDSDQPGHLPSLIRVDQPGHLPSLIRVFAVRMKKAWVLSYSLSAQRRLWSDWPDAQADLSLRWAHMPFCWFCHKAAHMYVQVTPYNHFGKGILMSHHLFIDKCGKLPVNYHLSQVMRKPVHVICEQQRHRSAQRLCCSLPR